MAVLIVMISLYAPAPFLKPARSLDPNAEGSRMIMVDGVLRRIDFWPGNRYHINYPGYVDTGWWSIKDGRLRLHHRKKEDE